MLHNYFVFKTNADKKKYVSIKNGDELLSYLTNKEAYTLEHLIIPDGKIINIQADQINFEYMKRREATASTLAVASLHSRYALGSKSSSLFS